MRCEPCRQTGLMHCSDPEHCGGPWDKTQIQHPPEMTDPNDMEDPQQSEILPPELYETWWNFCLDAGSNFDKEYSWNGVFRMGMELAYQQLLPYMQAALPYYEAGLINTTDAVKLKELAQFKEMATYEQ